MTMDKCVWCDVPIYVQVQCYTMPNLAAQTTVQQLEYELINRTGKCYKEMPKLYCHACGRKLDGKERERP